MDAFQRYYKDKIFEDHRLVVTASFAFCVITFEPIEVQTRSAPQNDGLNLSFVKDEHIYMAKKLITVIYESVLFRNRV